MECSHVQDKAFILSIMEKWNILNTVDSVFQIMDAIKGTMTEIYNDLSKSTSENTIAEVSVCAADTGHHSSRELP